ncbi:MAG TPA: T9SS type A sorting domain-containing protein, partial [Chitinophagales bacterium]|nr:T9SS type A sorting domain-containing protein [Chitinophagales bacterium]
DFRITNVLGDTILETGIPLLTNNDTVFSGAHQFPVCINEINGITTPFKTKSQVQILNSSANTLSVFNHNNYSIDYQVLDVLGRNIAAGNLAGNSEQSLSLQQGGVYIVRYTAPQFGTQAERVMVR